jgi:nitrous oxide reductase accessory protein NosL
MVFMCAVYLNAAEINYTKNDVCTVRKIKLYQYPKWVSQITLHGGKKIQFSSPKSMFEFYYKPKLYRDYGYTSKADIRSITVTDFITLKHIDATKAFFVYGSSNISGAGDDLPAFSKKIDAQNYAKKYNGKRVLSFEKVSVGLIRLLNNDI